MEAHKIAIGNESFNLFEATAPKQRELLSLIGSRLALSQASSGLEIDTNLIIGNLISMSDAKIQEISDIVLWKTAVSGKDELISIDHFQSNMSGYLQLVAGGVKANLQDFLDYLESASQAARSQAGQG